MNLLVSRYSYHLMCIPCLPISQLNVFNPHQRKSALKCCEHLPIDQRLYGVYCTPGVLSTVHCTPGAACQLRSVRDPVQTCPHRGVEPGRSVASGPKPGKCEEISELACGCWRLPHSENTGGGAVVQWCKCDTSVMAVGCSVTELCCPPQPRR